MCSTQRYFLSMVRQETLFSFRVFKQSSLTPFKLPCILWVEFRYGNMILSLVCKYRTIHSIVIRSSYLMVHRYLMSIFSEPLTPIVREESLNFCVFVYLFISIIKRKISHSFVHFGIQEKQKAYLD